MRIVAPGKGVLDGVCKRVAYLGSRIEYVVTTAWGELLIFDVEARTTRERGEPVGISIDTESAIVLPR